ncbi:hypothetical protein BN1723_002785 [Verticillium longisporum]|uniref:NADH dehydrogenase [ubiquinone] 1 alpha subcomplex assembly factor 3 n=1 Tax=Verticillium longisporum TaxID=100787 RepID=A0A0G4LIA5_VERLO|nr:hypothetical protein BN1723_002785 [Verticillium longisporum]
MANPPAAGDKPGGSPKQGEWDEKELQDSLEHLKLLHIKHNSRRDTAALSPRSCSPRIEAFDGMNRSNPMRILRALPRARPSVPSPRAARTTAAPAFHTLRPLQQSSKAKQEKPPAIAEKAKPTDLADFDVLGSTPIPSTNIEATLPRGFLLNSGLSIFDGAGALLVNGEAFAWRPWLAKRKPGMSEEESLTLVNKKGQFELPAEAFAVLSLMWPRPDLLVLGVGPTIRPLSPETRKHISALGMRIEVLDTRNASSEFNMLATERGVEDIAAALIPLGWVEGKGAVE